jgi:cyanophycinase-like exopeptidase
VRPLPEDPRPGSLGRLGSPTDTQATPEPALVLFGGAPYPEAALDRLRRAANGGDAVILALEPVATFTTLLLGQGTSSAETFSVDSRARANNTTLTNWILRAELLFLTDGWTNSRFVFWSGTFTEAEVRFQIAQGRAAAGGAGSGAAAWGTHVFGEGNGPVSSAAVLANPLDTRHAVFEALPGPHPLAMGRVIVADVSASREGLLMTLMARTERAGIGVDAGTGFAIGADSIGTAFGTGHAWIYDPMPGSFPVLIPSGQALDWNRNRRAVRVWKLSNGDRYDFRTRQPLDRPSGYYAWIEAGTFRIEADDE